MKICRCMALLLVCASCSDRDARGVRVTTAMAASVPGSGAEPVDVDPASLTPPAALRVEEFAIPNAIGACAAAAPYPHDPAVDAATGHVYYTDTGESCIGRLNPDTLEFTAWATATPDAGPHGLVVVDGVVYFTGQGADVLGSLDPTTGRAEDVPVSAPAPHTPAWQRGAIWFTAGGGHYGRFDPVTKTAQTYDFASPDSQPYGIWPAPDGSVWVALFGMNRIARVDTSADPPRSEEFALPAADARPRRIVVAADGKVWYTDYARRTLGAMDPEAPEGSQFQEYPTPGGGRPYGIAIGPDQRIWYDEDDTGQVDGFDPATASVVAQLPLPSSSPGPVRNMAVDIARQRVWLALSDVGRLAVIQF